MVATTDATLTNRKSSKQFLFRGVAPLQNRKSQGVIAIPLVNTSPDNTFLFRFSGQEEEVTFTFSLFDDNTDVSNGTESGGIYSAVQQMKYLRDTVYGSSYDTDWTFSAPNVYDSAVRGVITNLEFGKEVGSGTFITGTFTFKRGYIGAL